MSKELESAATLLATPTAGAGEVTPPRPDAALLAERYEVLGLLGAGGMGRVYRVLDHTLDEVVALKMLQRDLADHPGMLDRFRQEVKLARRVTSPHVVRTFDVGQHAEGPFLTMEFVDGRSLTQLLDGGPLPLPETMRVAAAVAAGVAAAHHAGVLHRDLKPDNVLVGKDGRVAITDFGIARVAVGAGRTTEGLVGTPTYMAPEQVQGAAELGPPVDVYAFGAMLFEMVTGKRAFPGDDPMAVALARLQGPPPDPRRHGPVPAALAELVIRCLARSPGERFADGSALAAALVGLDIATSAAPAVDRPPAPPDLPEKTARSIAVLPFRAGADLVELAEGLSEELIDTLSMTRGLRVRPLASVRRALTPDADPRELGATLGVDVVVEGTVRRAQATLRISARAIGVADGFQLWATRTDTSLEGILGVSDDIARAIAGALAVELPAPVPHVAGGRAIELYLEAKHRLRLSWATGEAALAIPIIAEAQRLAPDHPGILAVHSMALSRSAFYSLGASLAEARALAARAVSLAPSSGEAWLAQGIAALYGASFADAGFALSRAVAEAPGLAMAHTMLGALVLEAGSLAEGLAHLEAAMALDPTASQAAWDAARAHVYAGRFDEASQLLDRVGLQDAIGRFNRAISHGRFRSWQGLTTDYAAPPLGFADAPAMFIEWFGHMAKCQRTRTVDAEARAAFALMVDVPNPRLRATRAQFTAEIYAFVGDDERALALVEHSVDAGLQDLLWLDRCPLFAPLRSRARFLELRATVAARAESVLSAVRAARGRVAPRG